MVNRNDREFRDLLGRNTTGLRDLDKTLRSNKDSVNSLVDSLLGTFNVVSNLQKTLMRSERLQLKALSLGTNYTKFVASNTTALKDTKVSTQKMTEALMTGFDQGLRDNTSELNGLIDSMEFLGQDTAGMTRMMSEMSFITGSSREVQKQLVDTIVETNENYGVSNDRLVKGLDSLKGVLDKVSLFGSDAVGQFAELKTTLLGLTGGKGEASITTLLASFDPANISQQMFMGTEKIAMELASGNADISNIIAELQKSRDTMESRLPKDPRARAIVADSFGRGQITALSNVTELLNKNIALTEDQKKSSEDWQNTLKSKQERVDDYYDSLAPEMHSTITKFLPQIAIGLLAARGIGSAGDFLSKGRMGKNYGAARALGASKDSAIKWAAGQSGLNLLAKTSTLSKVARLSLGLATGPIGIGLTVASFLPSIISYFSQTAKNTKESAETLKGMKSQNKPALDTESNLKLAAAVATHYTLGGSSSSQGEVLEMLREMKNAIRSMASSNDSLTFELRNGNK